jgi:hypothetical protein
LNAIAVRISAAWTISLTGPSFLAPIPFPCQRAAASQSGRRSSSRRRMAVGARERSAPATIDTGVRCKRWPPRLHSVSVADANPRRPSGPRDAAARGGGRSLAGPSVGGMWGEHLTRRVVDNGTSSAGPATL